MNDFIAVNATVDAVDELGSPVIESRDFALLLAGFGLPVLIPYRTVPPWCGPLHRMKVLP